MKNNGKRRKKIEKKIIKKDDEEKIIKKQSKLTFNGIQKFYTNYDRYTYKHNNVPQDNPSHLELAVLTFSKLFLYETFYNKFQPRFGGKNTQLP